jgi:hypothetical protein
MTRPLDEWLESPSDQHFADQDEPPRPIVQRFFETLYERQSGILELRTVPLHDTADAKRLAGSLRTFVPVHDGSFDMVPIQRFLTRTEELRMAAYFGVALRTPEAVILRKGDAAHCQTLTVLFADCDFKQVDEALTRRRLATFPRPPSVIVNSGGGLHVYWLVQPPFDLQRDYPTAQSILRRLAHSIASDVAVSEPARVLRVPDSFNFKREYGEPRRVIVEAMR